MPSVTRRSKSNRGQRRDEARARLLRVVEDMLDEGESFTELSVERLVQAAGMSRSTFYVYFEDKGDLLHAWFSEINEDMVAAAAPWWAIDGDSTRADVHEVLERIVRTYRPHTTLMAATYDAAAYDESIRRLVAKTMNANIASLRRHIAAGQKAGFVDAELPAAQTAAWLTWMAERGLHQLVRSAGDAELENLIDAYTAIVWNTLYAPCRG
jgi:AcrR family transcriptional regulator